MHDTNYAKVRGPVVASLGGVQRWTRRLISVPWRLIGNVHLLNNTFTTARDVDNAVCCTGLDIAPLGAISSHFAHY